MLLKQVVEVLDKELERLEKLREIVSSLEGTVALAAFEEEAISVDALASFETIVKVPEIAASMPSAMRVPARRQRERRTVVRRASRSKESSALTSAIPAGPVVIPPALARERVAKRELAIAAKQEPPAPGTLGAMIRALHLDAIA